MCKKLAACMAIILAFCVGVEAQNDPNLVGYWNFDDGTATDLSGNGNNGNFMGQATVTDFADIVFGGSGFSLDTNFQNRNTDWLEIPHSESLNITQELTILAWIRPDRLRFRRIRRTAGTRRLSSRR